MLRAGAAGNSNDDGQYRPQQYNAQPAPQQQYQQQPQQQQFQNFNNFPNFNSFQNNNQLQGQNQYQNREYSNLAPGQFTPEVEAARNQHLAAHREALARSG